MATMTCSQDSGSGGQKLILHIVTSFETLHTKDISLDVSDIDECLGYLCSADCIVCCVRY